jgi:hypothetical protein
VKAYARREDALVDLGVSEHRAPIGVRGSRWRPVYHGHDGLRDYYRDLADAWGDEIRIEPEAYFDLGEHTLAFNVLYGRGQHSGAEVTMEVAAVARLREDLILQFKTYAHREDALRDLGVSEDELEPIEP